MCYFFVDYSAGFGGRHGIQQDRQDEVRMEPFIDIIILKILRLVLFLNS